MLSAAGLVELVEEATPAGATLSVPLDPFGRSAISFFLARAGFSRLIV
jgi:hypothetical protein